LTAFLKSPIAEQRLAGKSCDELILLSNEADKKREMVKAQQADLELPKRKEKEAAEFLKFKSNLDGTYVYKDSKVQESMRLEVIDDSSARVSIKLSDGGRECSFEDVGHIERSGRRNDCHIIFNKVFNGIEATLHISFNGGGDLIDRAHMNMAMSKSAEETFFPGNCNISGNFLNKIVGTDNVKNMAQPAATNTTASVIGKDTQMKSGADQSSASIANKSTDNEKHGGQDSSKQTMAGQSNAMLDKQPSTKANYFRASFDCSKQGLSSIEKMVCSNEKLASMDVRLASAFQHALSKVTEKDRFKLGQRQWLAERNECADAQCVEKTYKERIADLEEWENR